MNKTDRLKSVILSLPGAKKVSGGREVVIRCVYCGDSKNPKSAHMYVSLPTDTKPALFHCFKCQASGLVDHSAMMRWGIYDSEVLTDLSLHNKSVLRRKANRKYSDVVFGTSIPIPIDDKLSRVKLNYINTRLNIGLRYEDLPRFKIVLNLKELLRYNHVLSYTRSEKDIDLLDRCFVGFLSEDNGFVILRKVLSEVRMPESLNRRYVNYNIYGSYGNVNKRYTIPCRLNLLTPDPIRICVSEGPFDILSVFVNKMIHADDSVYSAAVGSDMTSTFVHAMSEYGIVNPELHAYMDNDAKEYHTELLKNNLKRYACPLYFHWNSFEGEKDFGVSNERIAEFEERIL